MSGDGAHKVATAGLQASAPAPDPPTSAFRLTDDEHRSSAFRLTDDEIAQLPMARWVQKTLRCCPLCALRHSGLCRPALFAPPFPLGVSSAGATMEVRGVSIEALCAATGLVPSGNRHFVNDSSAKTSNDAHDAASAATAADILSSSSSRSHGPSYAFADCWLCLGALQCLPMGFQARHLKDHGKDGGAREEELDPTVSTLRASLSSTGYEAVTGFRLAGVSLPPSLTGARDAIARHVLARAALRQRMHEDKEAKEDERGGKHLPREWLHLRDAVRLRLESVLVHCVGLPRFATTGTTSDGVSSIVRASSSSCSHGGHLTTAASGSAGDDPRALDLHLHLVAQGPSDQDLAKLLGLNERAGESGGRKRRRGKGKGGGKGGGQEMETNKRQRGVESESSSSESRASSSSSSNSIACDGAAPTTSSNSDTGSAEMSTNDDTVCASPDFFAARHPSWIPPPPQRPVPNVSMIGLLPTAQAFTNAVAAYDRHHQCAASHGNDDEKATERGQDEADSILEKWMCREADALNCRVPSPATDRAAESCWLPHWSRPSVFIGGRYRKLARDVPQSAWFIPDEGRKGRGSVEECITEIVGGFWTAPVPFLSPSTRSSSKPTPSSVQPLEDHLPVPKSPQTSTADGWFRIGLGAGGFRLCSAVAPDTKDADSTDDQYILAASRSGIALQAQTNAQGHRHQAQHQYPGSVSGVKFHGAGREDMDVLMLGRGRPFILEVIDPHRLPPVLLHALRHRDQCRDQSRQRGHCEQQAEVAQALNASVHVQPSLMLPELERAINNPDGFFSAALAHDTSLLSSSSGSPVVLPPSQEGTCTIFLNGQKDVEVEALQIVDKQCFDEVNEGAEHKEKTYRCVVWCSIPQTPQTLAAKLGAVKDLLIQQETPIRVLHRRTSMTREKRIRWLRPHWKAEHWFELDLLAGAGTYIKEFVHGDLGRTRPSVADLLNSRLGGADLESRAHHPLEIASSEPQSPPKQQSTRTVQQQNYDSISCDDREQLCRTDILQLDVLDVHTSGLLA